MPIQQMFTLRGMEFDFKKRFEELAGGKKVPDLAREAEKRGIPIKAGTIYAALDRNGASLEVACNLAEYFAVSLDEFVGRSPPVDRPSDVARTEDERQLLHFFRNIDAERQGDLIAMGNRWYSAAHPEDRKANPFQKPKVRRKTEA